MPIKTIRICEEEEAKQMLKDGTLDRFLQQWRQQYPGESKMAMIKLVWNANKCGLREAKELVDNWMPEVRFEIGDRFYIRYAGDRPLLYQKSGAEWIQVTQDSTHTAMTDLELWFRSLEAPGPWGRGLGSPKPFRFKNYGEF